MPPSKSPVPEWRRKRLTQAEEPLEPSAVLPVLCAACGGTVGEVTRVAGTKARYKCHSCKAWTWLVVVAEAPAPVDSEESAG